jgi:hypothetical protein
MGLSSPLVAGAIPWGRASEPVGLALEALRERGRSCKVFSVGSAGVRVLMVNSCIKVRLDLQEDKSPVVVKGPFFPRVVNPRYRIRGTNV